MTGKADARHVIRSAQQQQDSDFPGLARIGQQQVLHGHALVMRDVAAQHLAIGGFGLRCEGGVRGCRGRAGGDFVAGQAFEHFDLAGRSEIDDHAAGVAVFRLAVVPAWDVVMLGDLHPRRLSRHRSRPGRRRPGVAARRTAPRRRNRSCRPRRRDRWCKVPWYCSSGKRARATEGRRSRSMSRISSAS